MSQENVERLHRALEAFARRDRAAWDELCDPNVEVIPVGDWPEGKIEGREAAWDFFVATEEPWEPGFYEMVEVIDDDHHVVTRLARDMRARRVGSRSTTTIGWCSRATTGRPFAWNGSRSARKPSKQPGCGSRPRMPYSIQIPSSSATAVLLEKS
jgi:ketosteroid isomerase-like protein